MRSWLLLLAACASSPAPQQPAIAAREGISIAIYASAERNCGVVDDRRWIEVANGSVLLDRIDPAAALQSLVIEPLGDARIRIDACVRERVDDSAAALESLAKARDERPRRVVVYDHGEDIERLRFAETGAMEPAIRPGASVLSPLVRCRVSARAGKYFVRVMHVTSTLAFRTHHELTMTEPTRARLATRFAIATPAWRGSRADVVLHHGIPGDATTRELARASIVLDGSTAILGGGTRDHPARLRSVYEGAMLEEHVASNEAVWGYASRRQVWVWLELGEGVVLPSGPLHATIALPAQPPRDVHVETRGDTARWPMWIDQDLLGSRRRVIPRSDGARIVDRVELTITNLGEQRREVWIEEPLRRTKRRTLVGASPMKLGKDVARVKLEVAPGKTERVGVTIEYEL